MFLSLISPAKRLDFEGGAPDLPLGEPAFATQARELIAIARTWSVEDIAKAMKLSDALANLNHQRFADFKLRSATGTRQAALLAFRGDVYQGLDADSLDTEQWMNAQSNLRILSGLYGLLRPLDAIQPYRLEMGSRVESARGNSLYAFWSDTIAKAINDAARQAGAAYVLNLASQEYFGAVDVQALEVPLLTCHFKEMRDGKARIISFNAKRARGLMARYMIAENPQSIEALKAFNQEGYVFEPSMSEADELTFLKQA